MPDVAPRLWLSDLLQQWPAGRGFVSVPSFAFGPFAAEPTQSSWPAQAVALRRERRRAERQLPNPDLAQQPGVVTDQQFVAPGFVQDREHVIRADFWEHLCFRARVGSGG